MRKKLLALVLATTAVLTFAACGNSGNTSGNNNSSNASTPTSSAQASTPESSVQASAPEEKVSNLEGWFKEYASDIKDLEDMMNDPSALNGSGISSIKVNADGNIFVYEYYLDDSLDWSSIPSEQVEEVFAGVIEAQSSALDELFTGFEAEFGFKLEGLRFTFYNPDGSVFYTQDVTK